MTKDDVLFGYRQQLFAEAARTNVSAACRTFGVHRSTYYAWKRQVDRHGLEMLRPRERRRPKMPNQLPKMIEERIVSFAIAHPGLGPKRVASELGREKWGAIVVSPNGVWKVLARHGLNTRAKRLGLIAGYAAAPAPRNPLRGARQQLDRAPPRMARRTRVRRSCNPGHLQRLPGGGRVALASPRRARATHHGPDPKLTLGAGGGPAEMPARDRHPDRDRALRRDRRLPSLRQGRSADELPRPGPLRALER